MNRSIQVMRSWRGLWTGARMGEARAKEQGGLSLIELLVAMSILLVIMGAIYGMWLGLGRTYTYTQDDIVAQQQAQAALGEMVEYIRTVRMPAATVGEELQKPIVSADANSIVIWTDTDRDPSHDLELVRFRVDAEAGVLYRDQSNTLDPTFPSEELSVRLVTINVANDVDTPLFSYVDFNGADLETPVLDPWSIREVHVNLAVDLYKNSSPVPHLLSSIIQPRNLRQ